MPFDFNPQQPSKPNEKKDNPSFDFGIDTSKPKSTDNSSKPSVDLGIGTSKPKPMDKTNKPSVHFEIGSSKPKPTDNKTAGAQKSNNTLKSAPQSTSKTSAKTTKNGSKTGESSGRNKRAAFPENLLQNKKVLIIAGVAVAFLLLVIVAVSSNSRKPEPAPKQSVRKNLTPEELKQEKLRQKMAKYDAEYAASKNAPKTEKQKLMKKAESLREQGDYNGAIEAFEKVYQMDPTDGYAVSQLISIYRDDLHNQAQVEKWEHIHGGITEKSLDELQKKSEERYNKKKN